jgi:L-amino acid N-acyltransferase YncA
MITVRDARSDDLDQFVKIFREIVEAGETYAYPENLSDAEIAALWFEGPPVRCIVAVDESGKVLGSARIGPNRPGRGSHISTASFMVDPAAQGRGVGRTLGEEALRWAREQGYHAMQFNAVVETNTSAVHLWQSLGFEILCTVPEAFDHARHGLVGLHIMYRRL